MKLLWGKTKPNWQPGSLDPWRSVTTEHRPQYLRNRVWHSRTASPKQRRHRCPYSIALKMMYSIWWVSVNSRGNSYHTWEYCSKPFIRWCRKGCLEQEKILQPGCGASYPATEAIRLTDVMVLGTFLLNKNAVYHPWQASIEESSAYTLDSRIRPCF